jgi:hypothetical protein
LKANIKRDEDNAAREERKEIRAEEREEKRIESDK